METNIVEVENFVQQSEERRGSAFTQEVKRYTDRAGPEETEFKNFLRKADSTGIFTPSA